MKEELERNLILKRRDEFEKIWEENLESIYTYFHFRFGGDVQRAEDLTSRTMLKAFEAFVYGPKEIEPIEELAQPYRPWLFRIAGNNYKNEIRDTKSLGRGHAPSSLDAAMDSWGGELPRGVRQVFGESEAPEEKIIREERILELREAIGRLPSGYQEVLVLKFIARLQNREIGLVMGRSEGAIKSLYHRTLVKLGEELGDKEGFS